MPEYHGICGSIQAKRVVTFTYPDRDGNVHNRVVEPYALGVATDGSDALNGYQIGGTRADDLDVPGWGMFLIKRIIRFAVTDQAFAGNAPGHEHAASALNPIYCRVP